MLPLEELTIGQLLRRTAARFPERLALEHGGRVWSYGELDRCVDRTARLLLGWGVERGDHVGIWCEAEPNAILVLYALARIGAVAALLNTSLRRPELAELLRRTDIRCLVIGDGYKQLNYPEMSRNLLGELPTLRRILYVGLSGQGGLCDALEAPDALLATAETLAAAETAVAPGDTGLILYTSGTTSVPKAVLSSHFSRVNSGIQQARDLAATETDRFCVAMPIFHCFSLSVNVFAACAVGACLYLPRSRRTTDLLEAVSLGSCTVMSCVPALYHAVLCRPDFAQWDLSSLRVGFIGGSLYTPELFQRINDGFGFTLLSSLGQTEATAGITTTRLTDSLRVRATTVGHFMNHVEGKLVHIENGWEQPPGESGEICVRGYVVMQGYYRQSDDTARVVDEGGWLHTGDMGYLDPDGNLHMTGRLKELIIRGGENISPAEVEAVLADDSRVAECKAVGVPDLHYGEEICLCVVPAQGVTWSEEALRARLSDRLADFKVPKYILCLEQLPRTTTGKIRPAELTELAKQRLGLN